MAPRWAAPQSLGLESKRSSDGPWTDYSLAVLEIAVPFSSQVLLGTTETEKLGQCPSHCEVFGKSNSTPYPICAPK